MNRPPAWLEFQADHPALSGHFPGEPIVPGVLLLDEALHTIAPQGRRWRIASAKFHRTVRPLEPLRLERLQEPSGQVRLEVHSPAGLVMSVVLERAAP